MTLDAHTAVVDNDFINHLVESRLDDTRLIAVLNIVFSDLGLTAVVHPLVYDNEVMHNHARTKLLFQNQTVQKAEFSDIFQGDANKQAYYIFLVTQLYRKLTGKVLSVSGNAVLSYWARKNSLGEVHSISMCLICQSGIFLSDDGDSKELKKHVEQMALGKIDVYNRTEFFDKHMNEGINKIARNEKRSLTHTAR